LTSRVFAVFLGFVLFTSLLVAKTANADETPASAASKIANANNQTRVFLKAKMAEMKIPALQVAVVVNGHVVMSEAYGTANIEQQISADRKTLFPINSATKSFTGVAIMQLVEAGLIDLEAPVSRYLEGLPESWRAIRIRQLLAHSSGLPNIVDQNGLIGGGGEAKAWDIVRSLPMESVPGTGFSYNQTNYVLLARLIDKLSGRPFIAFFAKRQFKPAGMTRARFGDGYDIVPGRVSVYIHGQAGRSDRKTDPEKLYHWIDEIPESIRTGAGLYTNADELAQWIIALEKGGLLAKKSSVDRLWAADKFNDGKSNIWAMGWPILAGTSRRAVGGIGGGRSAFFVYPDDNVAVIVMTNMVGANPQNMIDTVADNYIASNNR
jgi:CubicO group peptidase (beta-lactamase class C family)